MSSKAKRVALLSRPGAAGERLVEVLGDAGVEVVLQADPTLVDVATVLGSQPDTLLVALDGPTEDALERLEAAFNAPSVDVIYEEAAMVVAREGWDAARWRRHLLAKLQGHSNVLPPAQAAEAHEPQVTAAAPTETAGFFLTRSLVAEASSSRSFLSRVEASPATVEAAERA